MGDEPRREPPVDFGEAQFRRRARTATLVVALSLVVLEIVADVVSQLIGLGSFHASEAIVGTLFGGALLIGGLEGLSRLIGR